MTWQKIPRFNSDNCLKDAVLKVCSASWFVKRYDMGTEEKGLLLILFDPQSNKESTKNYTGIVGLRTVTDCALCEQI